jgi:ABC-type branched-subunit amino acid transport system substrate-binding protein
MKGLASLVSAVVVLAAACTPTSTQPSVPPTTTSTKATTTPAVPPATTTTTTVPTITTDGVTVTDDTIYLGVLADLTGPFSGTVVDVLDAQLAFWQKTNEAGGIAGRQVELLIANTGYDVATHVAKYEELRDKVVMFAHSTGSQQTLAIVPELTEDHLVAIPVTWYSGWSDPTLGANLLETGSNYCMESINTISWYAQDFESRVGRPPTLALLGLPGDYGGDSLAGATYAASQLGLQIVYTGTIIPGDDLTLLGAAIAESGADLTWMAADPLSLVTVMGSAVQLGYQGQWAVSMVTFSDRLLNTALGGYMAENLYMATLMAPFGAPVDGMEDVVQVVADAYPDRYPAAGLVEGYLEYLAARTVLEHAAAAGDLTPEGVETAAHSIDSLTYAGLSPANDFGDDFDTSIARATGIFKPDKAAFDAQGGLGATLGTGALSPLTMLRDFFVSDLASAYEPGGPCYVLPSQG